MTAPYCCADCGAELAAAAGREACGCAGPFPADEVDPMHIRPYAELPDVGTPDDVTAQHDAGDRGVGQDEHAEAPAPVLAAGAADPYPTAELPVTRGVPDPPPPIRDEPARPRTRRTGPLPGPARSGAGRRRRPRLARRGRRPLVVTLTAVATAVVLGGGLLTVQRESGADRAVSGSSPGVPDHRPGTSSASPAPSGPERAEPSPGPSEGAGRPGHGAGSHTGRSDRDTPLPSGPRDSEKDGSAEDRAGDGATAGQAVALPRSTLRVGDSGPEVAQLQRRLKQVDFLAGDAPEDGVFSTVVQESVFRFQAAHGVGGDTDGEFGPRTREALSAPGAA